MQSPPSHRVLTASMLLIDSQTLLRESGLLLDGSGRIAEVLKGSGACRRVADAHGVSLERHEGLLAPGFVCAHAHLDLGALAGEVSPEGEFPEWIARLLAARARISKNAFVRGQKESAAELLRSGTTLVGDIDALGLPHAELGPRAVRYRELLDLGGDPERRDEAREQLAVARETVCPAEATLGLSPHAPYTSSTEWMREIAASCVLPVAIHWAETSAERQWLEEGRGPFARLLGDGAKTEGSSALDRIEAAGLLRPSTALIHANDPQRDEIERVARSGASLVHCPGASEFFDREAFPLGSWRDAGVPIALGTDSAAGNDSLSMLRELRILREAYPELEAAESFEMATVCGARALGLEGLAGALVPGAYADLCLWPIEGETALAEALGVLTRGGVNRPQGLWIHGRARSLPA